MTAGALAGLEFDWFGRASLRGPRVAADERSWAEGQR